MSYPENTTFKISKFKLFLTLIGCIVFVVIGIWMLTLDPSKINAQPKYNSPIIIYAIAVSAIVFLGFIGILTVTKMFDSKRGLLFDKIGFHDNSSLYSNRFIPWSDVTDIIEHKIYNQKLISVHLSNPEKYMMKTHGFKRFLITRSMKAYGTPINISANSLQTNHKDLIQTFKDYLKSYRFYQK